MSKTHTARWHQNSPATWVLKETIANGGAVLATVSKHSWREHAWEIGHTGGVAETRYAAQRAVRRALREEGK